MGCDALRHRRFAHPCSSARSSGKGLRRGSSVDAKVAEYLHISEVFEHASEFDLIHSHYDFMALAYTRLVKTPVLTTIQVFLRRASCRSYEKYRDGYFVSISDSDRAPGLNYLATVYNGIDLALYPRRQSSGEDLIFIGRIHPDKGVTWPLRLRSGVVAG